MSKQYDEYLNKHIDGVRRAFDWLDAHFQEIHENMVDHQWIFGLHDASKYGADEYTAYDDYFYGGNKSYEVVKNFNYAWLHHIHVNKHHWQHWVLQHDDEPEEALDMPYQYIIEMICDWWSFSFVSGNLYEIFDWYGKHKDMKLSDNTRITVEDILKMIKEELDREAQ